MADLNIRIMNQIQSFKRFAIYLEDVNLNVKNFETSSWFDQVLAPTSITTTLLPEQFQAQGSIPNTQTKTQLINIDFNTSYEIYNKTPNLETDIDIQQSTEKAPIDETINFYNKTNSLKELSIFKNTKLIFSDTIRPDNKLNLSLVPIIYVAVIDYYLDQGTLKVVCLSPVVNINYTDKTHLTITLKEDATTGKFIIEYNFDNF